MLRLKCAFQVYEWGKIGAKSEVYKLLGNSGQSQKLDESKPYAELWMGTHISGPSFLMDDPSLSLESYISEHFNCLGSSVFGKSLPFLFKVLSVRKALSIQAHPDKEYAVKLHAERPDLYKDSNHKPELAIALTPFEAMVAFRPPAEIGAFAKYISELYAIIGSEYTSDLMALSASDEDLTAPLIKAAYSRLMTADPEMVSALVNSLKDRLISGEKIIIPPFENYTIDTDGLEKVFIRLATDFPGDVGCFSLFFFNYIKLNPGEAIFLEPNLPHAYLSGDCVECMASSDNVIRAGLTQKFKDVDHLLRIVQYEPRWGSELKFAGQLKRIQLADKTPSCTVDIRDQEKKATDDDSIALPELVTFSPPVDEFAVDKISIPGQYETVEFSPLKTASILIIMDGKGRLQRLYGNRLSIVETAWDSVENPTSVRNNPKNNSYKSDYVDSNSVSSAFVCEYLNFDRGSVFFISAGVPFCIHQLQSSNSQILAFRAYANVSCN
ncbi:unnamed protein product [Heterobilharzia americana]|nr:unnamed protein product [Heterobilharzia americana]